MDFATKTEKFVEWLANQDVEISNKVEVQDLRSIGQGRALIATEDISLDEDLFKLPKSIFLNATNNSLIADRPDLSDKVLGLSQWEALIFVLVYEWQVKGAESKWKPYFDVLPINDTENYNFDQLIFWSEEEVALLKPSFITKRIGKSSAEALLQKVREIIQSFGITELEDVSQQTLHKAAALIMSYSFDVQREEPLDTHQEEEESDDVDVNGSAYIKSMLPLADTLNADTKGHNASLMNQEQNLIMRSIKDIKKGEQVFNTYSDHPNSEILRRYGYVEPEGSLADFAEISLEQIKNYFSENTSLSASNVDDIISILLEVQEEEDEEFVIDSYDCYVSGEAIFELIFVVQLLTVLAGINNEQTFNDRELESKGRAIRRVFKKCYQLLESGKLTEDLRTNIIKIIKARMSDYKSIENEDLVAQAVLTRPAMAKVVLRSEYEALRKCADGDKLFSTEERDYSFIPDQKLLKNILKKDLFLDDSAKKQKTDQ